MAWQGVVCWGVDKEGKRKLGKGRLAQNFGQHQLLSQFFLVQPFHRPKAVLYKVLFTCLPISFVFHQNKNKAQGATENVLGKNVREDPFALTPPTFGHCPNSDWTPPPHSTGHSGALFVGPFFTILQGCMLPKTVSAPNHLGKRLDPPKNKDMPI